MWVCVQVALRGTERTARRTGAPSRVPLCWFFFLFSFSHSFLVVSISSCSILQVATQDDELRVPIMTLLFLTAPLLLYFLSFSYILNLSSRSLEQRPSCYSTTRHLYALSFILIYPSLYVLILSLFNKSTSPPPPKSPL